jgi:hypothetical protein
VLESGGDTQFSPVVSRSLHRSRLMTAGRDRGWLPGLENCVLARKDGEQCSKTHHFENSTDVPTG